MKRIIASILAAGTLAGGLVVLGKLRGLPLADELSDITGISFGSVFSGETDDTNAAKALGLEPADVTAHSVKADDLPQSGAELNECLMLVNGSHTLAEDYEPSLTYYNEVPFEPHTAEAYKALKEAVDERFGEKLYISSSYRTAEEQQALYEEQGSDTAQTPEASEHRTGMALDVYVSYYAGKGFIKCDAGKWVNANCADFGFIIRYPKGKKSVTGISYEPWHLRYVGAPHAQLMTGCGLTLEEYAGLFEDGVFYSCDGYLIAHESGETLTLPDCTECSVSPDGCGGYFVTARAD